MSHCTDFNLVTHILHQCPESCPSQLALSLQQAVEKACLQFQVFIKVKWVMMMDCVLAACLESLTLNNDPKYWDLFVVLSYFIPPRMSCIKALIQDEEPFQKYLPPIFSNREQYDWLFVFILVSLFQFVCTPSMQWTSSQIILLVYYIQRSVHSCSPDLSFVHVYQRIIKIRDGKVLLR